MQQVERSADGVGRFKLDPRLDEANRYREAALRRFDERNDRLALAAVRPIWRSLLRSSWPAS